MAKRREQLDPFGASLLDMMCCGLGAAIIVFVLRQMAVTHAIQTADAAKSAAQSTTEMAQRDAESARRHTRQDARRIRDARQVSMFGLPPLGGNVCILLDCSGSMKEDGKLQVAKDCVASVLRGNSAIGWLRVAAFTTGETVLFSEELPDPGTQRRADRLETAIAGVNGLEAGGGTDVPTVLSAALAATEVRGSGTIVLFTDGISPQESERVLEKIRSIGATRVFKIHCVGLFRRSEVLSIAPVEGRFPGQLLREAAMAGRGVFVGVPVPIVRSP